MPACPSHRLRELLQTAFAPIHLTIDDESARHHGHAGAAAHGGGHFAVIIVSTQFHGRSALARHRAVYRVLQDEFRSGIHALRIAAYTPEEWEHVIVGTFI